MISLNLGSPVPLYFQRENHLLGDNSISYGSKLTAADLQARLRGIASSIPEFAESPRTAIDADEYETLAPDSLALLHTDALTVEWRHNMKGTLRPRAIFMTEQGGWDISYTGEQWAGFPERRLGERRTFGPTFVTVSVGDVFNGSHFVLAAGALAAV